MPEQKVIYEGKLMHGIVEDDKLVSVQGCPYASYLDCPICNPFEWE